MAEPKRVKVSNRLKSIILLLTLLFLSCLIQLPFCKADESISLTLTAPSNGATITTLEYYFNYTATLLGSDQFYGANLYLNGTMADGNSTTIVNGTNSIIHAFTGNGTYVWDIRVNNSTNGVFSSNGNFTVTVAIPPAPTPTPSPTPEPTTLTFTNSVAYISILVITLFITAFSLLSKDGYWSTILKLASALFWFVLAIGQFIFFGASGTLMILSFVYAIFGMLFVFAVIKDSLSEKHHKAWDFDD